MADTENPPGDGGAGADAAQADAILSKFGDPQQLRAAATQLDANTVTVNPSGATFPTISAALASITDASLRKQYLITAGPGTYNERVILKPYVYLHGSGTDQTVITTAPVPQNDIFNRGTIVGASNSSIANLTASCLGGNWGDYSTALIIAACTPFMVSEIVLLCDDQGHAGVNMETVAVNFNTQPWDGPALVYMSYAAVLCNAQSSDSGPMGMVVNGQANMQCRESKVVAKGNGGNAVASNGGATVTLDDCYVEGAGFALNIPDYHSTLIANNCTINGPVQNGVQINNDPPPAGGS